MNKKPIILAGMFLSGVVAGVLLVMRWMRMDSGLHQTETSVPDAGPASVDPTADAEDQHGLHRFTEPIKTGAKADIVRVRRACTRVVRRSPEPAEQVTEDPLPA